MDCARERERGGRGEGGGERRQEVNEGRGGDGMGVERLDVSTYLSSSWQLPIPSLERHSAWLLSVLLIQSIQSI